MDRIKGILIGLLVILLIIVIPVGIVNDFFNFIFNAIKWIVFIDNAETGLPYWSEVLIKGAIEVIILGFAAALGISNKNPFISIAVIIIGFVACIIFYWIAQYIVWIMIALLLLVTAYSIYLIVIKNKDKKEKVKGAVIND